MTGALALGTMMFGRWGNPDRDACRRMVDIALDAGIDLIDTADIYDFGVSEEIVGEAIAGRRDRVVLATKVGNAMSDDPAERGLSRRWILASCDASLRRLGVDHIDVYQMHRPDPDTPLEESLAAFDELVRAGKVGAVGTSTFPATQLDELQRLAADRGWVRPTSEQPPYSVLVRGIESEVLPVCRRHGIGVLVWAPLNGGWLTGKYQHDDDVDPAVPGAPRAGPLRPPRRRDAGPQAGPRRSPRRRRQRGGAHRSPSSPSGSPSPTRTSRRCCSVRARPSSSAHSSTRCRSRSPPTSSLRSTTIVPPGTTVNPADAL